MTTLHLGKSIGRSPLRLGFLLIPLVLVCFGLLPAARAAITPGEGGFGNFETAEGQDALKSLTSGPWNTALGGQALFSDTTGGSNVAVGLNALYFNIDGKQNTAVGTQALQQNTHGIGNIAIGRMAAFSNTTGTRNTALGFEALFSNTTANDNTAVGWGALASSSDPFAVSNTAVGSQALISNTTGDDNTAVGFKALQSNTDGPVNTAFGEEALASNTHGDSNNATGFHALFSNTTGVWNEAYGFSALVSNVSGSQNTAVGDSAGNAITGSFNINIGSAVTGGAGENSTTRIGLATAVGSTPAQTACFIGGIFGQLSGSGTAVFVNSDGKLGTTTVVSSRRFKDQIKPMDKASEAILALKPVTFRYKKEIDPAGTSQFGLVAEEVEKVNPDLIVRDKEGKPYTVRYDAVNAMLLNEFLKEHRKVEDYHREVQKQDATIAKQQKQIEALTTGLQKVSDQLELSKPAPQTALNNQ